jgi:hypothetical protein
MGNSTLKNVRADKAELEREIADAIVNFVNKHEVKIDSLYLERIDISTKENPNTFIYQPKISISI